MRTAAALLALLTVVYFPVQPPETTRVLSAHFKREDQRYQYLPFDVGADIESVTITYRYSDDDGASVVDIGLFEPGPLTLNTTAFRGYSGGAQRTITVGRRAASPGYRIGPMPTGQWHVLLGLYRVAATGVSVEISIAEAPVDATAVRPATTARAAQVVLDPSLTKGGVGQTDRPGVGRVLSDPRTTTGSRWYSGALHLHTTHSDGASAPAAVSDLARSAGLDFIAITDHNNTTHTRESLPGSPLYITGEEVTTPMGHASVWGLQEGAWIDFRVSPKEPGADGAIDGLVTAAHRAGALFAINHPVDNCGGCSWERAIPRGIDAVEIWQNEKTPRAAEVAFWDRLLMTGAHVTAVGVSDWHRPPARIDMASVRVLADSLTKSAVLDSIRSGRVIVMRDATSAPPTLRAQCGSNRAAIGETLTCTADEDLSVRVSIPDLPAGRADFIWNAARMTSRDIGRGTTFTMPAAAGYLRVHVYAGDGSPVAVTNPVYVAIH